MFFTPLAGFQSQEIRIILPVLEPTKVLYRATFDTSPTILTIYFPMVYTFIITHLAHLFY